MTTEIWSDLPSCSLPGVSACARDRDEAEYVAGEIRRLLDGGETIALFYRANWQSRIFEDVFFYHKIPYLIFKGIKFWQRKEVKDIMSWLRVIVNPYDAAAFTRMLASPPCGIGEKTIKILQDTSAERKISIVELCLEAETLLPKARKKAVLLQDIARRIRSFDVTRDLARQASLLAQESGLLAMYEAEDARAQDATSMLPRASPHPASDRRDNIREVVNKITAWEKDFPDRTLRDFVTEASLLGDNEQEEKHGNAKQNMVQLMTVHNAKGLEFDHVFLTGLEEKIFPHHLSVDAAAGLEEERRLFYVAVTRAKKTLRMSFAYERRTYGAESFHKMSRFVSEIPSALVRWHKAPSQSEEGVPARQSAVFEGARQGAAFGSARAPAKQFPEGCRVRHKEYGEGTVISRSEEAGLMKLRVTFGDHTLAFIEIYAALEKIT
jgi:DNA helicase-2/ATP-dependent DNA helicase PcrA